MNRFRHDTDPTTPMQWSVRLESPDALITIHHQKFVSLLNLIVEDVHAPKSCGHKAFVPLLMARMGLHSAYEEFLMIETGFPSLLEHKTDHDRLLEQINSFMKKEENTLKSICLIRTCKVWFWHHMRQFDNQLNRWLSQKYKQHNQFPIRHLSP